MAQSENQPKVIWPTVAEFSIVHGRAAKEGHTWIRANRIPAPSNEFEVPNDAINDNYQRFLVPIPHNPTYDNYIPPAWKAPTVQAGYGGCKIPTGLPSVPGRKETWHLNCAKINEGITQCLANQDQEMIHDPDGMNIDVTQWEYNIEENPLVKAIPGEDKPKIMTRKQKVESFF